MTLRERNGATAERLTLYQTAEPAKAEWFADEVRSGLTAPSKRLSAKYLYDDLGSALFEAICYLPEYYLTKAEAEILARDAGSMLDEIGGSIELVELGSGSAQKTRLIITEALRRQQHLIYHPIDISAGALIESANRLIADFEGLHVSAHASDYFDVLSAGRLETRERVLALLMGSNIGNYEPVRAAELLSAIARALRPGDGLLLGADLKKDPSVLERAYDDAAGVTAAFNKNLLGRINRELGGNFDLRASSHVARWDEEAGSVDSFLVAGDAHDVRIEGLDLTVPFARGEAIHTESSHKFSPDDIASMARAAGFAIRKSWKDAEKRFGVWLLVIE